LQEQNRVKRLHPETVSYGFGIKIGVYPETMRLRFRHADFDIFRLI